MSFIDQAFKAAGEIWLGYKYIVLPTNISFVDAQLLAMPITEIDFPSIETTMYEIPSLSNKKRNIPSEVKYGTLTLRSPVMRNSALFALMKNQIGAIAGNDYEVSGLVIALMGSSAFPITLYYVEGAQPVSFQPASATAVNSDLKLDELTLQVDRIYR